MRPEWGEQNTTGANCVGGASSVKGGVSSARIEARSLACMRARRFGRSKALACGMGYRFPRLTNCAAAASRGTRCATLPSCKGAVYHSHAGGRKTLDDTLGRSLAALPLTPGVRPATRFDLVAIAAPHRAGPYPTRHPHFIARLPNWRQIWLTALLTVTVARWDRSPVF